MEPVKYQWVDKNGKLHKSIRFRHRNSGRPLKVPSLLSIAFRKNKEVEA